MNRPPSPFTMLLSRHTRRREFITLLGGAAARGRSRRARSSPSGCGASACSCIAPRTIRKGRRASRRSCRGCSNWAGPIGRNVRIDIRWASGRCRPHSQTRGGVGRARARRDPGPAAPQPWRRCCRRPAPCRSCSCWSPIRLAPASSTSLARPGGNATGFIDVRIRLEREMAGAAQGDRARRDASGGPSRSRHRRRHRPVWRHPGRGAVARAWS